MSTLIKLTVEGTEYEFNPERFLVAEARELKTYTGFTPPRWFAAIDEQDPDALAFLVYLAKKREGEQLRYSDLDTLDYADFDMEIVDLDAEEEAQAEQAGDGTQQEQPDPTPASGESGQTPTPDTSPTSDPSPTTSSTPPPTSAV